MHSENNSLVLLIIAFTSGMSIMAMEISASRLIAPYFGTSLFVWTNIIGVVLVALSIGYYVGGKFSDKHPNLNSLLWLLCSAGAMFSLVPWIAEPIANTIKMTLFNYQAASVLITLGSFLLVMLLFAFPIILLGMVSPYVIKLYAQSTQHLGEQAGTIFAVSTIGSILGTFLPTLWLIPTIGTRWTILSFALLLIAISGIGLYRNRTYVITVTVVLILFVINPFFQPAQATSIYSTESAYQYINVLEIQDQRFLVFNEGLGIQSRYHPDELFLGSYYDYFAPLPALFEKEEVSVGIIGLAGGTLSRALYGLYGDRVIIDGVEIDAKVIEIARNHFDLDQPTLTVYNEDGKMFIERQENKYDILVVDAYAQQLYIPWTMTTKEFWEDSKDAMKESGILALNVNTTALDSPLFKTISNTIASVFDYTYAVPLPQEGAYNYIILASPNEIDFNALQSTNLPYPVNELSEYLSAHWTAINYDPSIELLTNDRAPIELMTEKMILEHLISTL
jgi:spermidine synthase